MQQFACVAVLLLYAVGAAKAQGPQWLPAISAGTRVRATVQDSPRPPFVGAFGGATSDSVRVILTGTTSLSLATSTLAHLDVSQGRERGRWAFVGGLIGAIGGGLIGGAALAGEADESFGLAPVAGFFAGIVIGAPMGAVLGAVFAPERWTRYPNPR
jgi:hypothetical protein